ncbi:MAG: hypothetical protein NC392_13635 [Roseburia sp.]|nr:hypothetical protein [Roseburia sp.]
MNQSYQSKSNTVTVLEHIETEIYMLYFSAIKEVHFSDTSAQSVEDKLKRVIFHDRKHEKQGKA